MTTMTSPGPATERDDKPSRGAKPRRGRKALVPFLGLAAAIALWWAVCRVFAVPTYIVPPPGLVLDTFTERGDLLLTHLRPTLIETLAGFALGNLVAVVLAILFVHWRSAERALMPVAIFIRTIPIVAIAPVLVIMLGNGYTPKIVIAALISFFPTLVNMVKGLDSVDRQSVELMRVLSASRREVFFKVRLFASLPYLFASLKIATGNSIIGAIVAEWIGSQQGLGYLIIQSTYNYDTPLLYAVMIAASLVAVVLYVIVEVLERLIVTWNPKEPA
jgi:NitT/TauT family transport system permease protein